MEASLLKNKRIDEGGTVWLKVLSPRIYKGPRNEMDMDAAPTIWFSITSPIPSDQLPAQHECELEH